MPAIKFIFVFVFCLCTASGNAAFVSSDFEITIVGNDTEPPYPFFDGTIPAGLELYVTNVGSDTANFQDNIFFTGMSLAGTLDGINYTDSPHYEWFFTAVDPFPSNGSIAPGDTLYFGGFLVFFDFFSLPNVSTFELTDLSLTFSNDGSVNENFMVNYNGAPVAVTITTPVPAVGLSILPLLLIMRRLTSR